MFLKLGEKLRSKSRAFRKDEKGVTVIEFTFLAPVFFFMLFVTFETGLMLFSEYVLQTSVQEAARLVRTGQAQSGSFDAGVFKGHVCRLARGIMDCDGKVAIYVDAKADFDVLTASTPGSNTIGLKNPDGTEQPVTFICGQPREAVAVIATYDWKFVFPWVMQFFSNMNDGKTRRLAGYAIFQNEPFPVSGNTCSSS